MSNMPMYSNINTNNTIIPKYSFPDNKTTSGNAPHNALLISIR